MTPKWSLRQPGSATGYKEICKGRHKGNHGSSQEDQGNWRSQDQDRKDPEKEKVSTSGFKPKVFFSDLSEKKRKVMADTKYFVLGELGLSEEKLSVRFEEKNDNGKEVKSKVIKQLEFPIHEGSKKRCEKFLN